ncbi:MAG: TRAP transporter small permease [Pikeienuella sp.]
MRPALNLIYRLSGILAALFIVAITALVFAQVCLNLTDRIATLATGAAIGLTIPSYSDFTGFFLAASTFLGLAYTLRVGGHIRVTLFLTHLPARATRPLGLAVLAIAALIAGYAAWYLSALVIESHEFGDRSSGMVSMPLWLVQAPVALGLWIFTIALIDEWAVLWKGETPPSFAVGDSLLSE